PVLVTPREYTHRVVFLPSAVVLTYFLVSAGCQRPREVVLTSAGYHCRLPPCRRCGVFQRRWLCYSACSSLSEAPARGQQLEPTQLELQEGLRSEQVEKGERAVGGVRQYCCR
ncbi:unnamed protein product, partial [Ectocarpus sp. 8 AP-2014]